MNQRAQKSQQVLLFVGVKKSSNLQLGAFMHEGNLFSVPRMEGGLHLYLGKEALPLLSLLWALDAEFQRYGFWCQGQNFLDTRAPQTMP